MKPIYTIYVLFLAAIMLLCTVTACGKVSVSSDSQAGESQHASDSSESQGITDQAESQKSADQAENPTKTPDPEEYAAFDEKTRKFLRQKFDYDDQKEITPNVLLVDYYEDGTRNLYTCYWKKGEIDIPEYRPMEFAIAEHIYITKPEGAVAIENLSDGRNPRCKIVRYSFGKGLNPYEQAAIFVDNSQVRRIIPEYVGEDNVGSLIESRTQEELQRTFSMEAGLDISEECWEWIADHCVIDPPYSFYPTVVDYKLWIKCYEPIDEAQYLENPYVVSISGKTEQELYTDKTFYTYYVDLEDDVNYFEGSSLFFAEGDNIVIIDYWYVYDGTQPDIMHG